MRTSAPLTTASLLAAITTLAGLAPLAAADQVLFDRDVAFGEQPCLHTRFIIDKSCDFFADLQAPADARRGGRYVLTAEWDAAAADYETLTLGLATYRTVATVPFVVRAIDYVGSVTLSGPSPLRVDLPAGYGESGVELRVGVDRHVVPPFALVLVRQDVHLRLDYVE